jgi:dihydroorotate dehydrogenase electron transfer subunit
LKSVSRCVAEVESHRQLAAGIHSLWARAPRIARSVRPGQFLNVRVADGPDPVLRRPISVCDARDRSVRLVFRVVGRGTQILSGIRVGSGLDLLGPLGKPAPRPPEDEILICGGGVGIAPLLYLARGLARQRRVKVFLGARTGSELILQREFRSLGLKPQLATDDGSAGHKGPVTAPVVEAVASARRPAVFACGPKPMLAELVRRLDPVPVWGFVEERIGCGTGICYCCALPKKSGGYVRFCEEGPVVRLNEVLL